MPPPRWMFRVGWAVDRTISRLSGGRFVLPNPSDGTLRTLFLRVVGRKSGKRRRVGLYYLEDGPNLVVVASNAGEDADPEWWRNLEAHPDAEVEVGRQVRRIRARAASPDEAAPLLERFVAAAPQYGEYRERTKRSLPIVFLEPR